MDNQLITWMMAIVVFYLLYRMFNKKPSAPNLYEEIINNDEYKAKGQWEKD
jgi:hypothetical protein